MCLETIVAADIRQVEQLEKRARTDAENLDIALFSTGKAGVAINDLRQRERIRMEKEKIMNGLQGVSPPKGARSLMQGVVLDEGISTMDADGGTASIRDDGSGTDISYQSADDFSGSIRSLRFPNNSNNNNSHHNKAADSPKSDDHSELRRGARCPVLGQTIAATGDQVYAPYLQRPYPLTDDVITQRRIMIARQKGGGKATTTIVRRLEVAHRLQKPKLLSDMRAFKAANPGAGFQDFVNWYGNPVDPLKDYEAYQSQDLRLGLATSEPVSMKLDKAAEAIRVLNFTRDFWADTWEEAEPIPAYDQEPLFDAENTVEMALDYLETLHPASLLNQIMAVNIGSAYFIMVTSAGKALNIPMVVTTLQRLRVATEAVLQLLALDATTGTGTIVREKEGRAQSNVVSVETISACERVCGCLAEAELLISRAKSLLFKLPGQYELIQKILQVPFATAIELDVKECRDSLLQSILRQQRKVMGMRADSKPAPSLREYLLRNTDDSKPTQLCVRYGDANIEGTEHGGLILALAKCVRE
jgi:Rab3 GTPase-activating protein catalytic subunit